MSSHLTHLMHFSPLSYLRCNGVGYIALRVSSDALGPKDWSTGVGGVDHVPVFEAYPIYEGERLHWVLLGSCVPHMRVVFEYTNLLASPLPSDPL
ncbi:hypothetical protein A0H81_01296 [Grifola frondosa]|uniref:Uncharacterized protein n=1 Tax=Grifola frondosa TaxID=5627 RepID=A0A1C7MRL9_GRIFR|nr:hypothetical protein A0H81_01296 [Grifola frondosa]